MTPDAAFARRLAAEIEHELERLEQLGEELAAAPRDDDTFALRARGSMLHDFYGGIERVFVRIAEELDGGVPQGEQWHRQIVTDMSLEIPDVRPAVIDRVSPRSSVTTSGFGTCSAMCTARCWRPSACARSRRDCRTS